MPYFQSIFSFDHIIIGEDNKILGILEAAAEISDERGEDVVRQQAIRSRPLPPHPPFLHMWCHHNLACIYSTSYPPLRFQLTDRI